jgi:membrane protein implicated in regulation of membrane protease activity
MYKVEAFNMDPGFILMLGLIFIVVISNKFLFWWVKLTIVAYYCVISYIFFKVEAKINEEYETPLPDAYWDKVTGWADTIAGLIFLPLSLILLFIFYKWYSSRKDLQANGYVIAMSIPTIAIVLFFFIMFKFVYGYRP